MSARVVLREGWMFWVYLLLSDRGEVYAGQTGSLKTRLRDHNSPLNTGWTRGRRWHLIAARPVATRSEAMAVEAALKGGRLKERWLVASSARVWRLMGRHAMPAPRLFARLMVDQKGASDGRS